MTIDEALAVIRHEENIILTGLSENRKYQAICKRNMSECLYHPDIAVAGKMAIHAKVNAQFRAEKAALWLGREWQGDIEQGIGDEVFDAMEEQVGYFYMQQPIWMKSLKSTAQHMENQLSDLQAAGAVLESARKAGIFELPKVQGIGHAGHEPAPIDKVFAGAAALMHDERNRKAIESINEIDGLGMG